MYMYLGCRAAQDVVMPIVYVSCFVACVLHPAFLFFFVRWFGFTGAPAAMVLSQWALLLLAVLYLRVYRPFHPETFTGFQWREAFRGEGMREFLALGLAGIASMAEWWYVKR
jgi:Na+-driven multidrug efflux pump